MANVTVYTMSPCPFCERAKSLLKQRGIAFTETKVAQDNDAEWERLHKLTGMRTMPMIFSGERLIGGFSDLAELDGTDQLASLK